METSLVIKSKDTSQKEITKSLTNINPNVDNAKLKIAAQMFTSISSGTYYDATKVNKINVDETGIGSKVEATIIIGTFNNQQATVTYNGDGTLQLANANNATLDGTTLRVGAAGGSGVLYAVATDNYTAAVTTF